MFQFGTRDFIEKMYVQGTFEQIKNDVLPHEITHTILASFFQQPVPRWADEGIASLSESQETQKVFDRGCIKTLNSGRGIEVSYLFRMKNYPKDQLTLYFQGNSICKYLVEIGGKSKLLEFIKDGLGKKWDESCEKHYKIKDAKELQEKWIEYLKEKQKIRLH